MTEDLPKTKKGRFVNPHIQNIRRKPKDFVLWAIGYYRDHSFEEIPQSFSYPMPDISIDVKKPWVTWIGHSTFLISSSGHHILTDPIWSNRCSPVPFLGPRRKYPPGIPFFHLPKIDYVLISHDHYDHLDRPTVEKLFQKFPEILWIVPQGVKKWFENMGIKKVVELSWWEEVSIDSIFKISSVPSQHFSGRRTPDLNKTLWMGFVVESLLEAKTFYFAGDTGYNVFDFKKIGDTFSSIDLSFIPIGAYSPRRFMSPVHVEPSDAVNIHRDVKSKLSLGMHWKTFRLSEEPMEQPPYDLFCAMNKEKLDPSTFLAIDPGHKLNW